MGEATQGLKYREDAWVREAQCRDPLCADLHGLLQAVEGVGFERAMVTHAFDREECSIDVVAEGAQTGEVIEAFPEIEVVGVVDREFGAEAPAFFEVLLEMGVLVVDVQTRLDTVGNDPRAVSVGWRRRPARESAGEEQADPIRAAQIQILPNDAFEKMAALDGAVENLGQTDFELADRDTMVKAGGAILGAQGPRQAVRPARSKLLKVAGAELVADRLETRRIGAREKAVVETREGDVGAAQVLFRPLVPVQTQLDRIRDIGADLDERRTPLRVLHVEIVVIHGDRLPREIERHAPLRANAFVSLERARLFLRHTDDHHAVLAAEASTMGGNDRIFVLPRLEFDEGYRGVDRKGLDGVDEPIMHRTKQRRRRDGLAEVIPQEVAQAARGL